MSDSSARDELDARHERDRQRRIEAVKRWVEYIESTPSETWGPQQNAVVDDQLEAAQSAGIPASHQQHVQDVATAIIDEREASDGTS